MTDHKKIGLIAGSGRFPILFAEEAKRLGVSVIAIAMPGITDPNLEALVSRLYYFKLGQISKPIETFKKEGVNQAVMAGKVQHASLFGGISPDLRAAKILWRAADRRTDTLLGEIASELKSEGIELLPSTTFLSHLLVPEGIFSRRKPTAAELEDILIGWKAAKAVAAFDIGQTVVAKEKAVIAVEAMEGTDACIMRAKEIVQARGHAPKLVVVKVAKPKQDLRFDIPIIGLETLKVFSQASVSALALEAKSAMIFDKEKFIKEADRQKIALISYPPSGPTEKTL
jgi:hypothetical protein